MAHLARVVIPGPPHDATQRGNHREAAFFGDDDYQAYLDLISGASGIRALAAAPRPLQCALVLSPARRSQPKKARPLFGACFRSAGRYAAERSSKICAAPRR